MANAVRKQNLVYIIIDSKLNCTQDFSVTCVCFYLNRNFVINFVMEIKCNMINGLVYGV